MIIPQIKKSRFGTGTEAIRVTGLGTLVEVDADSQNNEYVAQISEADTTKANSPTFNNVTITGDLTVAGDISVAGSMVAGSYNIVCYEDQVVCNNNEVVTYASLE